MRKLFLAIALLILLCSCGVEPTSVEISEPALRDIEVVELAKTDHSDEMVRRFHVDFLVPKDSTEAELRAHTEQYIEEITSQNPDLMVLALWYYDHPVYQKHQGAPHVADVRWGPSSRYIGPFDVAVGDYSTHTITLNYVPLDEQYEVSERELALYDKLQTEFIAQTGSAHAIRHHREVDAYEWPVFEAVAADQGVTVEELADIRYKVTYRRLDPVC